MESPFLWYALVLLGAAVVAVPLAKRVGLSSVIGYLAAGALIGPAGLGVLHDPEGVRRISELGVVLLMFVVGLELQPRRLWQMRVPVFGLGGAQVVGTGLLLSGGALSLGLPWRAALVAGLGLALSSTAFALAALTERNELSTKHGRAAFAILLFQDLSVIPLLAVLPLLAGPGGHGPDATPAPLIALRGAGVLVAVVFAGRFLLGRVFRAVAAARSREALTASALALVIGAGLLMEAVGLSMAFGAFVAGVLLADSEYRHELEANIEPFKGLLLGLFFTAVGMSVNLALVSARPLVVLGLVLGLVLVKTAAAAALARAFGTPRLGALKLALVISQGGEFAFVLFGAAATQGLLARDTADLLILAVTLSMATTPFALKVGDRVCRKVAEAERTKAEGAAPPPDEHNAVIIAGFGRFGQIVARLLTLRGIGFTALDQDSKHIDFVATFGNKVYFGDVTRIDLLRAAHAEKAKVLVLAIDDVDASMKAAELIRHAFPHLKIFARARNRLHAYRLYDLGIEVVVRETFLASVDVGRRLLVELGLPDGAANETARIFTDHDESRVRSAAQHHGDMNKLLEIAAAGREELQSLFAQDAR